MAAHPRRQRNRRVPAHGHSGAGALGANHHRHEVLPRPNVVPHPGLAEQVAPVRGHGGPEAPAPAAGANRAARAAAPAPRAREGEAAQVRAAPRPAGARAGDRAGRGARAAGQAGLVGAEDPRLGAPRGRAAGHGRDGGRPGRAAKEAAGRGHWPLAEEARRVAARQKGRAAQAAAPPRPGEAGENLRLRHRAGLARLREMQAPGRPRVLAPRGQARDPDPPELPLPLEARVHLAPKVAWPSGPAGGDSFYILAWEARA